MQGRSIIQSSLSLDWHGAIPVFRYAFGATLILAIVLAANFTLSYIIPVLALGFFAPGATPISFKSGILFVLSLALACWLGVLFSRYFLGFPLVFLPLLGLIFLYLYYSNSINPLFKIWLIVSFLLIPYLSSISYRLGAAVAFNLVQNAFIAIVWVWVVYLLFPYDPSVQSIAAKTKPEPLSQDQRFRSSVQILIVMFPVVLVFHIFQWTGSILVMIFVAILSLKPQGASFRAGLFLILANLAGGIAAILAFNLFTIVPGIIFLIPITLLAGLFFGNKLFSDRPAASLYGSAFSTFLLVLGSVTSSDGDAGEKVWTRIFQIGIAVSYFVIAYGIVDHFLPVEKKAKKKNE